MINIDWKTRAICRSAENKKNKKRIKELTISRNVWKEKAMTRMEEIHQLKKQIAVIKKNIQKVFKI